MPGPRVDRKRQEHYVGLRQNGWSIRRAASEAKVSEGWAKGFERNLRNSSGREWLNAKKEITVEGPKPLDAICDEAKAALADRTGALWCKRYYGMELSPFQRIAWEQMEDLYDSPDREFLCINAAPGLGKSTALVAFASKRIAKDRTIRVLFISRAQSLAERNTMRLRRMLERTSPAVGAESTLSKDFGRFKPTTSGDVWRKNEFVTEQLDGSPVEEKEPTCSAFGFDSEWLGNRLELVLGDDLDSTRSLSNIETVMRNRQIFDDELEPRLEGGGLFVIAQQRLGPFDFSAHALSKILAPPDDGTGDDMDGEAQYHHLKFLAHYEDRCQGIQSHRHDAPAWPEGCLLDPQRLSWRDLRKAMHSPRRYAVVYQQGDHDESDVLVPRIWVDGGRSPDGTEHPGCWDKDRGLAEIPKNLVAPNHSIVTCDPSPTKFWSIQWWLYNEPTEQRILLDLERRAMDAPDFLDFNVNEGTYSGLLEEWWQRANDKGAPFHTLIVEANAAQRFMLQYDPFRKWASRRNVTVIGHQTSRNKAHADFGVQSIRSHFEFGRVRLPGKQGVDSGRIAAMKLVDEVTRWPNAPTDDCVMAYWFLEWNLQRLAVPALVKPQLKRPSWLRLAPVMSSLL